MKLSKKSLAGNPLSFGNGWVSNGHWAAPLSRIENAAILSGSPESIAAALGIDSSEVSEFRSADAVSRILAQITASEPWTVSPLMRSGTGSQRGARKHYGELPELRLAFSPSGKVAGLDRSYCDLLGIEPGMTVWTVENGAVFLGLSPFSQERPAVDDIAAVLMPVRYGLAEFSQALGSTPAAAVLAEFSPIEDDSAERITAALSTRAESIAAASYRSPSQQAAESLHKSLMADYDRIAAENVAAGAF